MRQVIALVIGVLLPFLGFAGAGQAQAAAQSAVEVQGTIQAVDCKAGTVVLSAPSGTNTISAADYTAVLVNATSVPFCSLDGYIGVLATAWLIASGGQFLATRIDVTSPVAVAPVPVVVETVSPVPIVGVVLGTVVVAGLVFLIARGPGDEYYRYPYYGEYYRHYYHREYRPYVGYYPASALLITVAPAITGVVLGIVVVNSLQYVLTRDDNGYFYRYPYYGPYRTHYYRPTYRPYEGAYRDAPVRQGDSHWDAPANTIDRPQRRVDPADQPTQQRQPRPADQPAPQRQPSQVYQPAPQRQPEPADQPVRQRQPKPADQSTLQRQPTPTDQPTPQRQPSQVYQPAPQRQPDPADQPVRQRQPKPTDQPAPQRQTDRADQPTPQRQPTPAGQNSGHGNVHGSPTPDQRCESRQSDDSCSKGH